MSFYPRTDDPPELAQRLALLVRLLIEHPGLIRCAAEDHADPAADPHPEN